MGGGSCVLRLRVTLDTTLDPLSMATTVTV
jgi:hypothetical protein